jgi:hypothetical protein
VALVSGIIAALSLSTEQARLIGGYALGVLVVLDAFASTDTVPHNSPRDFIVWLAQWRGPRWLPLTGAWVPFMVAALIGHFFHPGWGALRGAGGFPGLGLCAIIAGVLSIASSFTPGKIGSRTVSLIALAGILCGVTLWPVGG